MGRRKINNITPREWMMFLDRKSKKRLITLSKYVGTSPEEYMEYILDSADKKQPRSVADILRDEVKFKELLIF